jgi:hypothetical protein
MGCAQPGALFSGHFLYLNKCYIHTTHQTWQGMRASRVTTELAG